MALADYWKLQFAAFAEFVADHSNDPAVVERAKKEIARLAAKEDAKS